MAPHRGVLCGFVYLFLVRPWQAISCVTSLVFPQILKNYLLLQRNSIFSCFTWNLIHFYFSMLFGFHQKPDIFWWTLFIFQAFKCLISILVISSLIKFFSLFHVKPKFENIRLIFVQFLHALKPVHLRTYLLLKTGFIFKITQNRK